MTIARRRPLISRSRTGWLRVISSAGIERLVGPGNNPPRSRSSPGVRVVDSHTEGEPTRTIVSGGPDLGDGPLAERRARFAAEFDEFRTGVLLEPRGSDAMVGALLVPPNSPGSATGVIFFNNSGYLSMCGHGTIGVVATLAHLGRIGPGRCVVETPAGAVPCRLRTSGEVTITNVPSYRVATGVRLDLPGYGPVVGEIAWGGNWFFLSGTVPVPIDPRNLRELTSYARAVRTALDASGRRAPTGEPINHIELEGPPRVRGADAKNFVLCPGGEYDRSPCGTGTSALMACRHADGRLRVGERWRQEGIWGTLFDGQLTREGGRLRPQITGRAYITGESELRFDPADPFRAGLGLPASRVQRSTRSPRPSRVAGRSARSRA
jgi:4-hydroxyproline epimerase